MKVRTVCFLIANFDGGGAQKQCIYLLNELERRDDMRLVLVYLHGGEHWPLLDQSNVDIHHLDVSSNYDPRVLLRIARIVRAVKADVLISWMHTSDSYSFFVRALTFGRVKWVMTERDSRYADGLRFRIRNLVGRRADAIVSNSAAGDAYWLERHAKGPRYVVDNIVHSIGTPVTHDNRASVLHIGRLEPQKNPLAVTQAFCELAGRRPELEFAFLGEGSLRGAVEEQIAAAGFADRIAVLGFRTDAQSILASAGAVVSLSSHEGLPNVLLEAAAAGVPIAASAIPEHVELLGEAYPFYVDSRADPTHVADVIAAAFDDPQASDALTYARTRMARMSPRTVAESYVKIFSDVCDAK